MIMGEEVEKKRNGGTSFSANSLEDGKGEFHQDEVDDMSGKKKFNMQSDNAMGGISSENNVAVAEAFQGGQQITGAYEIEFDSYPVSGQQKNRSTSTAARKTKRLCTIELSNSGTGLGSWCDVDFAYSPTLSPRNLTPKAVMPNVSPELLHLVDSAIMGKIESVYKLKNIVSGAENFGSGQRIEGVSVLVVDSLLSTMGGVESFDSDKESNPPRVMLNSRAALIAGELIPWLPWEGDTGILMSPRTRMVRGLLVILRSCTRNRAMCSTAGLLGVLLASAEKVFSQDVGLLKNMRWNGSPLVCCIQYLAGHSVRVTELHKWFQAITRTLTTIWAPRLMSALEKAIGGKESRGPACTFEFDGESSGFIAPGESNWPFNDGFAFATWLYIETFQDTLNVPTVAVMTSKSGKSSTVPAATISSSLTGEGTANMPRLFSFLSDNNQILEAYFRARFLLVENVGENGKKTSLPFTHEFRPQRWYFIGLEYVPKQGLPGSSESEIRLYIDGSLYESHPFVVPHIYRPLAFCCIGTNAPSRLARLQRYRRRCPLFAEIGPIYIFKEPIGPKRMRCVAARGGDAFPPSSIGAGLPWRAANDDTQRVAEESSILDAEIGEYIHLLYHPTLLNGRICPDASPSAAQGMLQRPAEVLGHVHVAARLRPAEAFWAFAYGGPMSLLPLAVSSVHKDSLEPEQGSASLSRAATTLAAPIFRILSIAIKHPRNGEELCHTGGPELLARILNYLLKTLSSSNLEKSHSSGHEELVAAIVSLCHRQKDNHMLKVQLFRTLLLDLRIWSLCDYGLQKKLLSSLADMVFTESSVMRDANAIQMLLDGCRRCYWVVREKDSVVTFPFDGGARLIGEVNALVEELLVVIELLMIAAPSSHAPTDIRCLLAFIVDCPQPNQVVGVLHLIYRLVVQPNTTRAKLFVEAFLNSAGIETLLVLLQRETEVGDHDLSDSVTRNGERMTSRKNESDKFLPSNPEERSSEGHEISREAESKRQPTDRDISIGRMPSLERGLSIGRIPSLDKGISIGRMASLDRGVSLGRMPSLDIGISIGQMSSVDRGISISRMSSLERSIAMSRMSSVSENSLTKDLGGINLPISADNARNNVYSVDKGDKIVTMIIWLLGALMASGCMKFGYGAARETKNSRLDGKHDNGEGTMSGDKISLLFFSLQRALQAAPNRLLTNNVYLSLLGASMNASSKEDGSNIYEPGQCFEHLQLLLVLMRLLPYASRSFQSQVLQDLLFLACSHPENRRILTKMDEWPEWILEILISNYEIDAENQMNSGNSREIDDLIHNFLIIVLQNSMRQKDGWKDIEALIHCAEWLSIVGGSSTGDRRIRREESLPIFKRRLFSGLLDFAAEELQAQTHASTAAEGWAEKEAKAEAGDDSHLSMVLVENAVVVLMLVEDHLRLQGKLSSASQTADVSPSPLTLLSPLHSSSKVPSLSRRESISSDSGEFPLNVLASLSDPNGEISATVVERLTAASAAEPYETISSAFASYGSCVMDLAEGWKYRSRLWFGVGLPSNMSAFGGGGSGWDSWSSNLQKDSNGSWIELPLVQQSVDLLHCLLNNSVFCGGVGSSQGSSTGLPGNEAMHQLLDSDQPFFCMLRMVLLSMREEDNGEKHRPIRKAGPAEMTSERSAYSDRMVMSFDNMGKIHRSSTSALLRSVLSPLLNKPVTDSKRQRVLVASSVLYSEVWHAVGSDRKPLRKQYLEAILPPFSAVLKRWRPLLAGIHELATNDGLNPLDVKDEEFLADVEPIEAAVTMISPAWAAAFASPPAAMALAMIAAGASGMEMPAHPMNDQLRHDTSVLEHKTTLNTFSSFQKALELPPKSLTPPKDKAAAKAAALAAARDLERTSKIGSGSGLTAVAAMASSSQRRHASDMERIRRWNIFEAMGIAWTECQKPIDTKSIYGKDFNALSYKFVAILAASFSSARNVQRLEIDRRTLVDLNAKNQSCVGACAWRRLIHYLIEMKCLFGPFGSKLSCPARILWKLDTMETSSRTRLCLRRSYKGNDFGFGTKNIFVDLTEIKKSRENFSSSRPPTVAAEAISEPVVSDDEDHLEINNLSGKGGANKTHDNNQLMPSNPTDKNSPESAESMESQPAYEPNLVAVAPCVIPNDPDERIVLEFPSSMVRSLTVVRGTFQVTSLRINFIIDNIGNYTAVSNTEGKDELRTNSKVHSWLMSSLRHIYTRRFLLRRSALELFMVDRSNFFFDFGNMENRRNAYRAIVKAQPTHLDKSCLTTQRPEQILKQIHLTERWSRWEISNFEYLMQLNTLAGRTYNDLAQYPIFPWILSDYSSQDINLADPYVYRDLSKPVGALNPSRLIKFKERYANFNEPDIPKYHYDSHYSNASIVLYYLVRLEPFTSLYIQLQDAKLNHADQMFSDFSATWNGVLEDMNDVKELVPELFYLPEVLTNENSVYLGTTHVGKKLESVKLPPWAKDPVDFIHKHRMALEGEHVSAHLHEWIDLIFGYKQQGKEAALANNVFPHVSYEGTVDIDKIRDPVHQHATKYQIAYFGQIPTQLLTAPHMKRRPLSEVLHLQTIFRNPKEIKSYAVPATDGCNLPASAIHASSDAMIIVDTNAPAAYIARHKWQPCASDGQGLPFTFLHAKTTASSVSGAFVRMLSFSGSTENDDNDEWVFSQALAFASCGIRSTSIVCITCDKEIITGGHADNSIKLLSSDGAKTLETALGHCAPVTCLALSPDSNYLVTGSRDTTMLLWRILRPNASSKASTDPSTPELTKSSNMSNILTDKSRRPRIEGPLCVLRGHQKEILSCCVNSDLGVIVSCAQSSDVLLHSMRRGCLIRRFVGVEANMACLSSHGVVMTWNEFEHTLSTFTLNGVLIARTQCPFLASISCMEISLDGESALVGMSPSKEKNGSCNDNMDLRGSGNDDSEVEKASGVNKLHVPLPSICFLDLHSLQVFHVLKLEEGQDVTTLALTKDNKNIIVSTADKELIVFTDPALSQ